MKHVVILAHPSPSSFNASIARFYTAEAETLGNTVIVRDLYRLGFDPVLKLSEIVSDTGCQPADDVVQERAILSDADVIILVYPLWLNMPPAILKGYVERVFGYGFAYTHEADGMQPRLRGKKLLTFSTSGAPTEWIKKTGDLHSLRALFDTHLANMCGFDVLDHVHFGGLNSMTRSDVIERYLGTVRHTMHLTRPFTHGAAPVIDANGPK